MASNFNRALSDTFIKDLQPEKQGWWPDVLADPKLLIALRGKYLNVYWRGQSLFCVNSGITATIHQKYLMDPKLDSQVRLKDGKFDTTLLANGFIREYEGPETLAKLKKAAGLFSGLEKTGCHEIAVRNPGVVDCEIAFPGKVSLDDGGGDKLAPRIDLAAFEDDGDAVRLVFWEAKHFSNSELRAANGPAPVVRQIGIYRKYLSENRTAIEGSYQKIAKNLVAIGNMGWKRELSPLINEVATGKRRLTLGAEPKVGLIIFGFDSAQRDHSGWKGHRDALKKQIKDIIITGDAKNIRL